MFQTNTNTTTKITENVSQTTNLAWKSINDILNSIVEQLPYVAAGLIVFGVFFLISKIIKVAFWSATSKTKLDYRLRVLFSRVIGFAIVIIGVFTTLTIIIPTFRFGDLIAGLGFTSFVVGFATKDILNNLLSGILILWKQPFHLGDYIFINKFQGKVEHIGVRATRLRADDGEQILIPNGDMYSNALTIRGAGAQRRMSLNISLGYETDIEQAKTEIKTAVRKIKGVVEDPKPTTYVRDLTSDGINISIYFWINTNEDKPLEVFDEVATEVKNVLSKNKVEIYPPSTVLVQQVDSNDSNDETDSEDVKRKDEIV
jgi:small conductance mechanosensitive channel